MRALVMALALMWAGQAVAGGLPRVTTKVASKVQLALKKLGGLPVQLPRSAKTPELGGLPGGLPRSAKAPELGGLPGGLPRSAKAPELGGLPGQLP